LITQACKSTRKDRRRQVVPEAQRIPDNHLFTIEPDISENQTAQKQAERLPLVTARPLHETYRDSKPSWLAGMERLCRASSGQSGRMKS
jgi:hypothetical protein